MKTGFQNRVLGICAMLFLMGASLFAQDDNAISKYFGDYSTDDRFSVVYVSPAMFNFFADAEVSDDDEEFAAIIKSLKGLHIITSKENSGDFYKEALGRLPAKEYDVLMEVRENDGTNVKFLTKGNGNSVSELLLFAGGENEDFVLMSFVGDLDLKKISKLSKSLNINGAEHLKKIENMR